MTIAGTTIQTSGSTGNGATTQFSFSFNIDPNGYGATTAASQVQVIKEVIATGVETVLTLTTDYTVSINADQSSSPGGSITMVSAPSSAYKIWIRLNPDFTQQTDFTNQGGFLTEVVEDEFDQRTRNLLVLLDRTRRSPRVGVQAGTSFDGEITGDLTAGAFLCINGSLTGFTTGTPSTGATVSSAMANVVTASTRPAAGAMLAGGAVSVKDPTYGALGDGATDDTSAISAAIAAALLAGLPLYFPPGTYITTRQNITGSLLIYGAGQGFTTVKLKDTTNNYIFFWTGVSSVTIRDLTLDGNQANNNSISAGIRVQGASDLVRLENIEVKNCRSISVSFSGTGAKARVRGCYFHDNVNAGFGVLGFTDGLFESNRCDANGNGGAYFSASSHRWRIHHNACNSNTDVDTGGNGILVINSDDCEVLGNYCASNVGHGIQWNTALRGRSIGNTCKSNTISGVDYYASPNGMSEGNFCQSNTIRGLEIDSGSDDHSSVGDICHLNGSEGISIFRSARASIISPNVQNNNTTAAVGGIRFWTNPGGGATSGSDGGCVIGGRAIDARGGSATQTYGVIVQTGTTDISVQRCTVSPNLTGTISADASAFAMGGASVAKVGSVTQSAALFELCLTGVNFNSANTDNAIPIQLPTGYTRYLVNSVRLSGASAAISTATCGLFTAAAAGGTAIVTSATAITVSTASEGTNNNAQSLTVNNGATQSYTTSTLYFRVQTAQGSAATANVQLVIQPLL